MGAARKLTKVGNSYAAIIPRQVMAVMGIDGQTRYEIATDGENLILKPIRRRAKRAEKDDAFARAVREAVVQYRDAIITLSGG